MARSMPTPKIFAAIQNIETLKQWEQANNTYVENKLRVVVEGHAEKVSERAKSLVPVKSGLLKSTIHVQRTKNPLRALVKTDHGKAPHDFLVHFGTVHSEGHPFLYQANEEFAADLVSEAKAVLGAE